MTNEKALSLLIRTMENNKTYIKCELDIAKATGDDDKRRIQMGRLLLITSLLATAHELARKAEN